MSSIPYDPASLAGQVRLLIDDVSEDPVFTGAEIDSFLAMNKANALRAAAQALLMIAGSEARISKRITTQDLSTDGPAVAKELREQAAALRKQADEDEEATLYGDTFFGIIEYPVPVRNKPELAEGFGW